MSVVGTFLRGKLLTRLSYGNPTSHQNVHPKVTHSQHVVTEAEARRVGVDTDGNLGVLSEGGDARVRAEPGG